MDVVRFFRFARITSAIAAEHSARRRRCDKALGSHRQKSPAFLECVCGLRKIGRLLLALPTYYRFPKLKFRVNNSCKGVQQSRSLYAPKLRDHAGPSAFNLVQ